ncbi:alpha/beta hydrolase [Ktedonobacter racemifer]|uniref:Alpha/beta hydrolase fold protein n=1 Tax=Ktedonobacter racemifer DSM 44963 TaxID=485913 RepID=D6TCQ8_KTERA|nr:alpha/beta hydrolase [Ktedonobacter racemifer]EFH88172.1 alpha/beta hydrolase fold protein [Ktedonobacter racemifer DSM 44963]
MTNATGRPGDSTIRLHDGRKLQSLEVGKRNGFPIFHFHGNGSSRLEVLTVHVMAEYLGIRLIGLDRPGIGGSDERQGYRLLDWPDDVVEVADQLGLERFAVEGLSGGAPFALACAYKIPHRLTACGLISPATGPFIQQAGSFALRSQIWMLVHVPWLVRALFRLSMQLSGSDEASLEQKLVRAGARLGEADHQLLGHPEIRKMFAQAMAESFRQAADASTKDGLVYSKPWGFQVEAITFENLLLWQGEQDPVMPAAAARLLAQALPHCTATFYPDEGHLSTFVNHAQDIWKALSLEREQSTEQ